MTQRIPQRPTRRQAISLGCIGVGAILGSSVQAAKGPKRQVAVTIDDGPSTGAGNDLELFREISGGIRLAFVEEKVPAIMFINESQLHVSGQRDARIEVVAQWLDSGLELGNHTYSHKRLSKVKLQAYFDDIVQGEVISHRLLRARDQTLNWFRYPFLSSESGERATAVERFLRDRNYRIAPVTVDYHDYSFASNYSRLVRAGDSPAARELFESTLRALDRAFEHAEHRSQQLLGYELPQVLLIHCNQLNALNLRETIQRIRDRGYEFVRLDEAMRDPAYKKPGLPPGALGGSFFPGLNAALQASNQG